MNEQALKSENPNSLNKIYNTACGNQTTLNELVYEIKKLLSNYDSKINDIEVIHGPDRQGDIPHSLASIEKAKKLLNYDPKYNLKDGLKESINWYWENLK